MLLIHSTWPASISPCTAINIRLTVQLGPQYVFKPSRRPRSINLWLTGSSISTESSRMAAGGAGVATMSRAEHPIPERRADAEVRTAVLVVVLHVVAAQELAEARGRPKVVRVVVHPIVGDVAGDGAGVRHAPVVRPGQ